MGRGLVAITTDRRTPASTRPGGGAPKFGGPDGARPKGEPRGPARTRERLTRSRAAPNPPAVSGRRAGLFLLLLVACREEAGLALGAKADDLLVLARLDGDGELAEVQILEGETGRLGLEDDDHLVAFILVAGSLIRSDGAALGPPWSGQVQARRRDAPPAVDGCGRCVGPTDPAPWPVYAGERCAIPASAGAQTWPDPLSAEVVEATRRAVELEWTGPCAWPLEAPARCTPAGPSSGGVGRDCRLSLDAATAWPDRPAEPPPLDRRTVAAACTLLAGCGLVPGVPNELIAACAAQTPSDEQRAIPLGSTTPSIFPAADLRWGWLAPALVAGAEAGRDCAALRGLWRPRPEPLVCGAEGCIWRSADPPTVTCTGTTATLAGAFRTDQRDCARVLSRCDEGSTTGCLERRLTACDPAARDRCDGPIKLGCTTSGLVSFDDCARTVDGTCTLNPELTGAACGSPPGLDCLAEAPRCNASGLLEVCTLGAWVTLDCVDLGAEGCLAGACRFGG